MIGVFLGKMCSERRKNHYCVQKNRKALALLTSGLSPNAASSSDMYFDSIRCYGAKRVTRRLRELINMGVFPGKKCSDSRKNHGCGHKKEALLLLCLG